MGKSFHTNEQIVRLLAELNEGTPIESVCKKYAATKQNIYWWKRQFFNQQKNPGFEGTRIKKVLADREHLAQIIVRQTVHIEELETNLCEACKKIRRLRTIRESLKHDINTND